MAFTFFFRDKQTLELIAQHVIPDLKRRMYINIWDAGCAMGPEPYSLAITLRENMGPFLFRNVRIYATDIDESGEFGAIINRGLYPAERVKRIPPDLFQKYFSTNGRPGYYEISQEMKKAVQFQQHDLLSCKPVREEFGLILCKNVLLHFQSQQRVEVIRMFHRALAEDGYLVIEQTQKLPAEVEPLFRRVTGAGQIFQKVTVARVEPITRPAQSGPALAGPVAIKLDRSFSNVSRYTWLNLEIGQQRIGKVRADISDGGMTIHSLTIYPEFERRGYAHQVITAFQENYPHIIAADVRTGARAFWEKMGFEFDQQGNYIWQNVDHPHGENLSCVSQ